jgi:hypothetical protein
MENTPSAQSATATPNHRGSCHCGAVRFEAIVNVVEGASKCNCSICLKVSNIGAVTKPEAFTLREGEASLSEYAWGGKTATRYFCKHCGVHCFGRGHLAELGGDYVSINVNTLDDVDPSTLTLVHWDGRHNNWHAGPRPEPWPVFATPNAER